MEKIKDVLEENKKELIIAIVLLFIVILQGYTLLRMQDSNKEKPVIINEVKEEVETNIPLEIKKVKVEIKGEVKKPGVYELEANKRVIDVINMAQGLNKNASTKANNLSKIVTDEMVIIIYSTAEIKDFIKVQAEEKTIMEACIAATTKVQNDSCNIDTNQTKDDNKELDNKVKLIAINTATKEELMTLPGIGEAKANNIIAYRRENGLFITPEDIKKVSGIGDSIYEQIKDFITL